MNGKGNRKYKRKGNKSNKTFSAKAEKQIAQIARKVTHKVQPTKEYRQNGGGTLNTFTPPNSGIHYNNIFDINHGTLKDQRATQKIYVSGLQLKLTIQNDLVGAPRYVRIMIIQNINKNAEQLDVSGFANLLQDTSRANYTPTLLSGDAVSPINTDILRPVYDHVCRLGTDGDANSACIINKYIPIRRHVLYDDEGNSTVINNGIYYLLILVCEPNNTPSTTPVKYNYMMRIYFKDA